MTRQMLAARHRGDWDAFLRLLREVEPYLDPGLVSYLRGLTWDKFGFPLIAILFFERASMLVPEDAAYLGSWLLTLMKAGRLDDAGNVADKILVRSAKS